MKHASIHQKIQGDNYLEKEPKVSHRLAKEFRIQQVSKIINQKKNIKRMIRIFLYIQKKKI